MAIELSVWCPVDAAAEYGLPGRLRWDGYELPPNLPFERWCEILETLQTIDRSVKWWLGDALRYGEATYHELASQAFPDAFTGSVYAESTLRAAAWVSDRFPRGTRVEGVTWTHHRVVADLPYPEAKILLDDAARINTDPDDDRYVSSRDLIEKVRVVKERLAGRSINAVGVEPETAELPWSPTRHDLADACRARLEIRLSEMSARMRTGFELGWMAAHVESDARDCFREWNGGA